MTAQDKKWRAQEDARALAQADEIRKDKARRQAAVKEAKAIALKAQAEAKAFQRVSKTTPPPPKKAAASKKASTPKRAPAKSSPPRKKGK